MAVPPCSPRSSALRAPVSRAFQRYQERDNAPKEEGTSPCARLMRPESFRQSGGTCRFRNQAQARESDHYRTRISIMKEIQIRYVKFGLKRLSVPWAPITCLQRSIFGRARPAWRALTTRTRPGSYGGVACDSVCIAAKGLSKLSLCKKNKPSQFCTRRPVCGGTARLSRILPGDASFCWQFLEGAIPQLSFEPVSLISVSV